MDRHAAWGLVCEWTTNPNLRKHMLAVEAAMRAYAEHYGEDAECWGIVGLVHDLDYERFPSQDAGHPFRGVEMLKSAGYPEVVIRAVLSHADYAGVPRQSLMEKTLFACDELTGFIIAVALVKPGRSLAEVDPSSVRRKLKDKAFARGVNRDDIYRGAVEIGLPLDEHIAFVLRSLQRVAESLGLGSAGPAPHEEAGGSPSE